MLVQIPVNGRELTGRLFHSVQLCTYTLKFLRFPQKTAARGFILPAAEVLACQ